MKEPKLQHVTAHAGESRVLCGRRSEDVPTAALRWRWMHVQGVSTIPDCPECMAVAITLQRGVMV